ncbi:MAG: DEAD/DEAH box helicase [Myxococcota bacterium]
MSFTSLNAPAALLTELERRGYTEPTPVQQAVVAADLRGRDLLVSSRTGSGKTVAFGLLLADSLLEGDTPKGAAVPHALIVAPTRELALQVARELGWLYGSTGLRIATCVGGMDMRRELDVLARGAHLVVGTPGRLCDHLERRSLILAERATIVLDEADEMLEMGFRDELERILEGAPTDRRTLLFSATLPTGIESLARRFTRDVVRVDATAQKAPHADIAYVGHLVAPRDREHAVVNILRAHAAASALVFCATRDMVARTHASLLERGFTAACLSGEMSQAERNRALLAVRERRAQVLVATDVAARGLDLPAVSLVVHADLPRDSAGLLHRSGRTGRAGKKGTAVLIAAFPQRRSAERLLGEAKVTLEWTPPPYAEDVRTLDGERLLAALSDEGNEPEADDLTLAKQLLGAGDAEQLVARLVARERGRLPAPEELTETRGWQSVDRHAPRRPRDDGPRHSDDGVWFRVNVGRDKRADPRWLLPLLCRRGRVQKAEIGKIDIRPRETRFQVATHVAERFLAEAKKHDPKDPLVHIDALYNPAKRPPRARESPRRPRQP